MRRRWEETSSGNDRGASSVEYGLIIGAIILGVLTAIFGFGLNTKDMFDRNLQCLTQVIENC